MAALGPSAAVEKLRFRFRSLSLS